eukprot:3807301-Prymnesium_polylepis.1
MLLPRPARAARRWQQQQQWATTYATSSDTKKKKSPNAEARRSATVSACVATRAVLGAVRDFEAGGTTMDEFSEAVKANLGLVDEETEEVAAAAVRRRQAEEEEEERAVKAGDDDLLRNTLLAEDMASTLSNMMRLDTTGAVRVAHDRHGPEFALTTTARFLKSAIAVNGKVAEASALLRARRALDELAN